VGLGHWQFDTFMGIWNKSWDGESLLAFQLSPVAAEVVSVTVNDAPLRRVAKPGD
jgi:hypothetical protein